MFRGDDGHDRVGPRTDVRGGAGDTRGAIRFQDDHGAGLLLERGPRAGGHSPADEEVSILHRFRIGRAVLPAELFGTEAVALAERLAGLWFPGFRKRKY